jgi:hypothetical protein
MKTCNNCSQALLLEFFSKDKSKKDGLSNRCKSCQSVKFKTWQQSNPKSKNNERANLWKVSRKKETRAKMLEYFQLNPCVDCKNSDVRVLQFDHKDGAEKIANVSALLHRGFSWENLLKEISKCDVRCANCHQIRTGIQFNYWNMGL